MPEQHCALEVQEALPARHDEAWTGVGATMLVTKGNPSAAVKPSVRNAARRVIPPTGSGMAIG